MLTCLAPRSARMESTGLWVSTKRVVFPGPTPSTTQLPLCQTVFAVARHSVAAFASAPAGRDPATIAVQIGHRGHSVTDSYALHVMARGGDDAGKVEAKNDRGRSSIADEYRRILRTHILPANGGKRIVDVRRAIRAPRGGLAIHLPPPSGFAFKSIAIIS